MKTIKVMLTTLIAVIFFSACDRAKNTDAALSGSTEILFKHQWNLTELDGQPVLPNDAPYLQFIQGDANKVVGFTGCNQIGGDVELQNVNVVKFSVMTTTKMACTGENVEQKFLAIFPKADAWSISIDELSLFQGRNLLAKFKGLPPAKEPIETKTSVLNGRWELDSISSSNLAFIALYPDQKPSLAFNLPTMEVVGSTGCNTFTSAFTLDSSKIQFINLTATEKACNGVGEPTFINAMKEVSSYSLVDTNTLTLMKGEVAMLRFMRR